MRTVIPEKTTVTCDICGRTEQDTLFGIGVVVVVAGNYRDLQGNPADWFSRTLDVCDDCYQKFQAALEGLRPNRRAEDPVEAVIKASENMDDTQLRDSIKYLEALRPI